ncbi:MAG: hypothetical protein HOV81_25395 [Kofleriaceae bacterium]|nr:hypothetical protein [Kofleriaceae bacterium]
MNRLVVASLVAAGCGRIDFAEVLDASAPIGHDEDGDGIGDADDPCPHVAIGERADGDGDGVGDACDPNPTTPGDSWTVFSPLTPGTNPFDDFTDWEQKDDALHVVALGSGNAKNLLQSLPLANARLELGFEIREVVGTTMDQHQVAGGLESTDPIHYFVELNENDLGMRDVAIVSYDGTNGYVFHGNVPHGGMHAGRGILRYDARVGSSPTFDLSAGWIGEMYQVSGATPGYAGASQVRWTFNGLDVDVIYVAIISMP